VAVQDQAGAAVAVVGDLDLAQVDVAEQRRLVQARAGPGLQERLLRGEAGGQAVRLARFLLARRERVVDEAGRGVLELPGTRCPRAAGRSSGR
jgi:hypothetical protein